MDKIKREISILGHIVKWCSEMPETHEYFKDNYEEFKVSGPYFKAIAMNLLQIGELANHLSAKFTRKYSDIPWEKIIGLRNVIAHGYGILEVETLWDTSHTYTDELQKRCLEIIAELKKSHNLVGNNSDTIE